MQRARLPLRRAARRVVFLRAAVRSGLTAMVVARVVACASADHAARQESPAAAPDDYAVGADEGGEAADAEAEAEAEAEETAPAEAPSEDEGAAGGAAPRSSGVERSRASPPRAASESEPGQALESDEDGGGLFGFLSGFVSDDEEAPAPPSLTAEPFIHVEAAPRVFVRAYGDQASYGLAQALLRRGQRPPPESVRAQDFFASLAYDYPRPESGRIARVVADLAPGGRAPGSEVLRVGLRITEERSARTNAVFLVDATDTSSAADIDAFRALAEAGTSVLVEGRDRLHVLSVSDDVRLAIDTSPARPFAPVPAYPKGQRPLEAALLEARRAFRVTAQLGAHPVLVIFTTAIPENAVPMFERTVRELYADGVRVVVVGAGTRDYGDQAHLRVARAGGGPALFVDDELDPSAARALRAQLSPALTDVEIEVRFRPEAVARYRLIGFARGPEVAGTGTLPCFGTGQEVTLLFEVERRPTSNGRTADLGTLKLRAGKDLKRSEVFSLVAGVHSTLETAPQSMQRATAAAALAARLRGEPQPLVDAEVGLALATHDAALSEMARLATSFVER